RPAHGGGDPERRLGHRRPGAPRRGAGIAAVPQPPPGVAQPAARQPRVRTAHHRNAGRASAPQRLRSGAQSRLASPAREVPAMKARLLRPGDQPRAGMVLARGVGQLQKGAILTEADLGRLGDWKELSVVEIEPGDVHEEAAGQRLAKAVCGDNVEVRPLNAGSWPLAAGRRGLVEVNAPRLAELNESDDLAVVTLPHGQIVVEDEIIARAKIVPFVTREEEVHRAERAGPVLSVLPFVKMRVAALVQENLDDASLDKFRAAFSEKVRFFGSEVVALRRVTGDLAAALRETVASGAQV